MLEVLAVLAVFLVPFVIDGGGGDGSVGCIFGAFVVDGGDGGSDDGCSELVQVVDVSRGWWW